MNVVAQSVCHKAAILRTQSFFGDFAPKQA